MRLSGLERRLLFVEIAVNDGETRHRIGDSMRGIDDSRVHVDDSRLQVDDSRRGVLEIEVSNRQLEAWFRQYHAPNFGNRAVKLAKRSR